MTNFWQTIDSPIIVLAPMEDVTDTVLRTVLLRLAQPDCLHVVMTEFVSTDLLRQRLPRRRVVHRLHVCDEERRLLEKTGIKLVAQIWGNNPEYYVKAIEEISADPVFAGIDINMGCPARKVVRRGCCSGLIANPTLAKEIIHAAKSASDLPVSVKTRIGLKSVVTEEWTEHLLEAKPAALAFHGRTQAQMSKVPADWNEIGKAASLRDQLGSDIPILGNGDVMSVAEARQKCDTFGLDGVMIGRGIFDNPWLFSDDQRQRSLDEKLDLLWQHSKTFDEVWGEVHENRRTGGRRTTGRRDPGERRSRVAAGFSLQLAIPPETSQTAV
jgi:tRNA-dihydrouridine synthase